VDAGRRLPVGGQLLISLDKASYNGTVVCRVRVYCLRTVCVFVYYLQKVTTVRVVA
jgi:hypothetical protein